MRGKVFSQNGSVGIGVITADDDDGIDAVLLADIIGYLELFRMVRPEPMMSKPPVLRY